MRLANELVGTARRSMPWASCRAPKGAAHFAGSGSALHLVSAGHSPARGSVAGIEPTTSPSKNARSSPWSLTSPIGVGAPASTSRRPVARSSSICGPHYCHHPLLRLMEIIIFDGLDLGLPQGYGCPGGRRCRRRLGVTREGTTRARRHRTEATRRARLRRARADASISFLPVNRTADLHGRAPSPAERPWRPSRHGL